MKRSQVLQVPAATQVFPPAAAVHKRISLKTTTPQVTAVAVPFLDAVGVALALLHLAYFRSYSSLG